MGLLNGVSGSICAVASRHETATHTINDTGREF